MKGKILCLAATLTLAVCLGLLPTGALAAESDFVIENGVLIKYNGPGGAVVVPDNVTEIGDSAFEESYSNGRVCTLTEVTLPDSLTTIGSHAFYNCEKLTSINIPDSVTTIGPFAFDGCEKLTSIHIPDGVTQIEKGAFGYSGLKSVELPPNIKVIGERAFEYCKNLTSVTIPNGVEKIGPQGFRNCEKLTDVTISASVTEIAEDAFGHSFGDYHYPTIHGVTGSEAERYAKKGYQFLEGSVGIGFWPDYRPLPFVAVDPTTLQPTFQPLPDGTPGFLTSQGLKILFTGGKPNGDGASYSLRFTNTTDERIHGAYALLAYNSPTQAQFWFFELNLAPGETAKTECTSGWRDLNCSKMLWVTFGLAAELTVFALTAPIEMPSTEGGYWTVDATNGPDFLWENFGIGVY